MESCSKEAVRLERVVDEATVAMVRRSTYLQTKNLEAEQTLLVHEHKTARSFGSMGDEPALHRLAAHAEPQSLWKERKGKGRQGDLSGTDLRQKVYQQANNNEGRAASIEDELGPIEFLNQTAENKREI